MCYSAQILAEHRKFCRLFGAKISVEEYYYRFWHRPMDGAKLPKAMEHDFMDPETPDEQRIKDLIEQFDNALSDELRADLAAQRARLAAAELKLQSKVTKTLLNEQRIATNKIARLEEKLSDLSREDLLPRDSRIFPGVYAPVMIMRNGERVIVPMRYQCRPAGTPASYDLQFPGTYNARRDSLRGRFWSRIWGKTHGLIMASSFYENVKLHHLERRLLQPGEPEKNVIVQFTPDSGEDMLLACIWSHWQGAEGEDDLLSFALITDEPPPEVLAAGHDRCIIPIKPEHINAWLQPELSDLAAQDAILDDRVRPIYRVIQAG